MIRIRKSSCSIYKFGSFLLALEVIWIALYISLCIYSFIVTTRAPYGGPMGEQMRTDTFSLRTHIMLFNIVLLIQRTRPIWLALPAFLFVLFSDIYIVVEIGFFSPLRDAMSLWIYALFTVAYQTLVTVLAIFWFVYMIYKNRVKQINNGRRI
jgi:hypothetical protein